MIEIMSVFDALASHSTVEFALADGDALFRAGDRVSSMYLVRSGTVRLLRHLPHGPTLSLQVAPAGSVLAEASLYVETYHCDAVACGAVRLKVLPRHRALEVVAHDPGIARLWAGHLAAEVQRARTQLEIITLKTVAERLDAWMALNGAIPGRGQWYRFASELAVTPEALYRELGRRRRGGPICANGLLEQPR